MIYNYGNESYQKEILQELESIQEQLQVLLNMNQGLVDFKTAAKILNVSKGHLYRLTSSSSSNIPFLKPRGKIIYFSVAKLIKWAESEDRKRKNLISGTVRINEDEIDQAMLNKLD